MPTNLISALQSHNGQSDPQSHASQLLFRAVESGRADLAQVDNLPARPRMDFPPYSRYSRACINSLCDRDVFVYVVLML